MFYISDDKNKIQRKRVYDLLKQTYWANQRSEETIDLSIDNSLCLGVYLDDGDTQVGFARVITDYATTFYICDVIVDEKYRGNGMGKAIVESIVKDDRIRKLRGTLATTDARGLYEKYGFVMVNDKYMGRNPDKN